MKTDKVIDSCLLEPKNVICELSDREIRSHITEFQEFERIDPVIDTTN